MDEFNFARNWDRFESIRATDKWEVLTFIPFNDFSKIGFQIYGSGERLEVDWISVELSDGWTDWVDVKNPYGSIIPDLDRDHPYLQWRALLSTEDTNSLPALDEITIVSGYPGRAAYVSPPFNTERQSIYEKISWDAELPEGTFLKFQIRAAPTEEELKDAPWLGPADGEEFYTTSGALINPAHSGDTWIQYRVIFETRDETRTPVLKEARIDYNVVTAVEEHAGEGSMPSEMGLFQSYPNPFNPRTMIRYALPWNSKVRLTICNLSGQKVRTLVNGKKQAGSYSVVWDGRDDHRAAVASGIYFYRLEAGDAFTQVKRMVLIR